VSVGTLTRLTRRVPALARAGAAIGLMWGFFAWGLGAVFRALSSLDALAARTASSTLGVAWARIVKDVLDDAWNVWASTLGPLFLVATLAIPLGMLARTVARARARAGQKDPLDAVRDLAAAHPRATRAVLLGPALLWFSSVVLQIGMCIRDCGGHSMFGLEAVYTFGMFVIGCTSGAAALGIDFVTRRGLRLLLQPTIQPEEKATKSADDRVTFDAVAVTTETRAAVAAMVALPFVTLLAIDAANLGQAGTEAALMAYVALAIAGTLAFRRASRIAVGVDGVFVTGTSRTRFFPYAALDGARAKGTDIELIRGSSVVLRLQLHGEDATQKDAILSRIQEAIEGAKAGATAGAGQVVAAATEDQLSRLAEGGADYRAPALTREQLWSLVEGPEHDRRTRTAAARALAKTGNDEERRRLRVAAEHCAEPQVRVLLLEMADDEDEPLLEGGVARLAR
jgi:hypothetical protein